MAIHCSEFKDDANCGRGSLLTDEWGSGDYEQELADLFMSEPSFVCHETEYFFGTID
jgi:hypothetical protein